jgi:hypothetical protein
MTRRRLSVLVGVAEWQRQDLGTGIAIAATGGGTPAQTTVATSPGGPGYSYYRHMMGSYFGSSMMGGTGGYRWMMSAAGYRWMFGGASVPAWMRGARSSGAPVVWLVHRTPQYSPTRSVWCRAWLWGWRLAGQFDEAKDDQQQDGDEQGADRGLDEPDEDVEGGRDGAGRERAGRHAVQVDGPGDQQGRAEHQHRRREPEQPEGDDRPHDVKVAGF